MRASDRVDRGRNASTHRKQDGLQVVLGGGHGAADAEDDVAGPQPGIGGRALRPQQRDPADLRARGRHAVGPGAGGRWRPATAARRLGG